MKILFITLLSFVAVCVGRGSALDSAFGRVPTMSTKEASVIKEASGMSDNAKILEILKEASEKKWAGSAIWFNLANAQMIASDYASAVESYRKAIEKTPSFFIAQKNLAFALEKIGRTDEAFVEMKKALALSGGSDCSILGRLATRSAENKDYCAALNFCNQALMYEPSNADMIFAKAIFLFELGLFDECEKVCASILSKNGENAQALRLIGKSRAKRGDYKSAISAFEILKKSGKAQKCDFAFLGDLMSQEKLYKRAVENYLKADKSSSIENATLALLYSGDSISALEVVQKLGDTPIKFKIIGLANFNLGKLADAKRYLEKYVSQRADDTYTLLRLADIYLAESDFVKAQAMYIQAQSDSKMILPALYGQMRVELAKNNYRSALRIAKQIEKINPSEEISNYAKQLEKHCAELE